MTKEALKLALEALEKQVSMAGGWQSPAEAKAITAIKKALAQPSVTVEQEPVAHSVVAGALFDFMGWLTSRNKRLTLSGADEASPAVEAIQEFSEKRGLSLKDAEVGFWTEFLSTPPQRKPLTDEEIILIVAECASSHQHTDIHFARAIEAKLKEKNT